MIFGPLFDENGRKLCRNAFNFDHYINLEISQPHFPNLDFQKSFDLEQIKEFKKLLDARSNKKKKKDEEKKPSFGTETMSPLRAAAISGDLTSLKEWSKGYCINARGGYGEPPILIDAVKANVSIDAIKLIIQLGAFINAVDIHHRTALHHACEIGSFDTIKLLLRKGAHYFLRDDSGRTPFHIVAALSSTKCLRLVLQYSRRGEEMMDGDNEGLTPLHWAVAKNHTEHLDIMLSKKYRADLKRTDIELKTVLHWCASHMLDMEKYKQSSAYKILQACNSSILNYKDIVSHFDLFQDGRTALHLACGENNMGLVQLLTGQKTCDINAQDDMKRTALHWASVAGYSHIVQVLLKHNAEDQLSDVTKATALHYAASKNHIQCVINLIEGRKYAYLPDAEGRTPIVWAILKGHVQTVRVLLDSGVNMETRDFQKCTPLHAAASSGNTMCASLLLQSGCEIDSLDLFSRTALFKTIENGHAETAALLLQKGANFLLSDEDGRAPIHFAALFGRLNVLSLLLASGADPNARDLTGKTPLHCAAYNGNVDAIKFLIKSLADVNMRDLDGVTALHWACGAGQAPSVELLLALGASPNVLDFSTECHTPLDYALSVGACESAQLVQKHGGLEAKKLIKKATAIIAKFWRKHKRATVPQHGKPIKEYRRGSIMRRLSQAVLPEPIIEVMHDSIEIPQIAPEEESHAKALLTVERVPNTANVLHRRHSTVSMVTRRRSSILDPRMLKEDFESDQMSAAIRIQKAWKRYCLKLETKFLIQVMGSEEASQMVERIMMKEREKDIKRYLMETTRRKSFKEFPSKSNLISRRSSFSTGNGIIQRESSDESNEFITEFGRKDSKKNTRNPSYINHKEPGSESSVLSETSFSNATSNVTSLLSPKNLGNSLVPIGKPLSRAPTLFKMTISEDELAYLAMERARNQEDD